MSTPSEFYLEYSQDMLDTFFADLKDDNGSPIMAVNGESVRRFVKEKTVEEMWKRGGAFKAFICESVHKAATN